MRPSLTVVVLAIVSGACSQGAQEPAASVVASARGGASSWLCSDTSDSENQVRLAKVDTDNYSLEVLNPGKTLHVPTMEAPRGSVFLGNDNNHNYANVNNNGVTMVLSGAWLNYIYGTPDTAFSGALRFSADGLSQSSFSAQFKVTEASDQNVYFDKTYKMKCQVEY